MAYANTATSARNGFAERLSLGKERLLAAINRRQIYARTLRELNALSDRELTDLGISRLGIPELAHEAAYGK